MKRREPLGSFNILYVLALRVTPVTLSYLSLS
jgi:hypothetical protein